MSTFEHSRNWQPTATSVAIVLVATVVAVMALLWQVDDVLLPVALGVVGALLFALSCQLLAHDSLGPLTRPVVSLLTLPVALGLFGSSAAVALVLAASLFPVESGALVSTTALFIAGHVGVVFGSVLAALGLALGARYVVDVATLDRYAVTTFLTGLVPGGVGLALVIAAGASSEGGVLSAVSDGLALGWVWLTAADSTGLDLAGFLFVLALATTSVLAAVVVLPVTELLSDTADGGTTEQRVSTLLSWLTWGAGVVILAHLVVLWLELSHTESELLALFGSTPYGVLETVATASALRGALLGLALVGLTGTAVGLAVRSLARQSVESITQVAGPLAGGLFVTLVAALVAQPVYETLLETVLESLPPVTADEVDAMAVEAAAIYGEETFAIVLAFALVAATLWFVVSLRLALSAGYLSAKTPGYSLASAGVFVGVVAAGTLGASAWLVFGGVLCSLLVWDVGRYGTTLGREIGTAAETRGLELVHAGATLFVGVLGVLAAVVLVTRVETVFTVPAPTTSVALFALATGLVSFVLALR